MKFSTDDSENDGRDEQGFYACSDTLAYNGAWWYPFDCGYSNLNGNYIDGGKGLADGMIWAKSWSFKDSLKETKMMIYRRI